MPGETVPRRSTPLRRCVIRAVWSRSTTSARTPPTSRRPTTVEAYLRCSTRSAAATSTSDNGAAAGGVAEAVRAGTGAAPRRREDRAGERPHHLRAGAAGRRVGDRRRRGPHHHRLDAVDRARAAHRIRLAGNGSAGLPASAPRPTARSSRRPARGSGCARAPTTNRHRWPTATSTTSPTPTCAACGC